MKLLFFSWIFIFLLFQFPSLGQNKETNITSLITKIASVQTNNDPDFPNGGFISYRKYQFSKKLKLDPNSFFTASIIYNMERYRPFLTEEEKILLNQIQQKAIPYFKEFENNKNKLTYNFWSKNPPQIFPNGDWLNKLNKPGALPDDIDDCSIITLSKGENYAIQNDSSLKQLKKLFLNYSNTTYKSSKGFYRKYKNNQVYSTWLGHKMPIDMDISVWCNTLLFSYVNNLPLNKVDISTMDLIVQLINNNKHTKDASFVSIHYENTATILYHLARLMCYSNYTPLLNLKPVLVAQAINKLKVSKFPLEKLLLKNTLLQLGEHKLDYLENNRKDLAINNYAFFIANLSSLLPNPFKRGLLISKLGRFAYYSYPYNLSLLIENQLLYNRVFKNAAFEDQIK